jgi:glycosyltransferase involved in cell wall biosynthesis
MQETEHRLPVLTIGLPVYNGAKFIERALRSLMSQDFQDWRMIIADNCSTDLTFTIAEKLCTHDPRIELVRHDENIGAVGNFLYLVNRAETPFFMWAASDDEWTTNYLSEAIRLLQLNVNAGFASGKILNIDIQGSCLREFPAFSSFSSQSASFRLCRFIAAREIDGKANIIYSVYRTPLVQAVCRDFGIAEGWGADMGFVAAIVARSRYLQSEKAALLKRVVNDSDKATALLMARHHYHKVQFQGNYPPYLHKSYVQTLSKGMPSAGLAILVHVVMWCRRLVTALQRGYALSRKIPEKF